MKKATKLFTSCICLCAIASLIGGGCSNSGSDDEIKATARKTTSSLVAVEEGSYNSVVSENNKSTVNAALDSAGIEGIVKSAADYSGFIKSNKNSSSNAIRSISADEFGQKISSELSEKYAAFAENIENSGKASLSYTITPGEITGLPEGIKMTVPLFSISHTASAANDDSKIKSSQAFSQSISSTLFRDINDSEEKSIFKQIAANSAQNFSYVVATTIDIEKAQNENYQNFSDIMEITGSGKIDFYTSSFISFVTDEKIAGKLSVELKANAKTTDFSNIVKDIEEIDSSESEIIPPEKFIDSEKTEASLVIDVCDLNGNFVYNYKNLTDISEIEKYVSLLNLNDMISCGNE